MTQVTVWFDGSCPLCRREIALLRRLDRRHAIEFVDLSPPDAPVSCPVDRGELLSRFHVRDGETMLSGAPAFAAMWRVIPALRPLGLAARNPRVLAWLDRFYVRFLRVRPMLQRIVRRLEGVASRR